MGGSGLGSFDDLLLVGHSDGFGDADGVLAEIDVIPLQSQELALPEAGIDGQVEQQPDLFGDVPG